MARRKPRKKSRISLEWAEVPPENETEDILIVARTVLERWPNEANTIIQPAIERFVFETRVSHGHTGFRGIDPEHGGNGTVPKMTRREKLVLRNKATSLLQGLYMGIDGGMVEDGAWID